MSLGWWTWSVWRHKSTLCWIWLCHSHACIDVGKWFFQLHYSICQFANREVDSSSWQGCLQAYIYLECSGAQECIGNCCLQTRWFTWNTKPTAEM